MNNSQGEMQQSWIAWWKSEKEKTKSGGILPGWPLFVWFLVGPAQKHVGLPISTDF